MRRPARPSRSRPADARRSPPAAHRPAAAYDSEDLLGTPRAGGWPSEVEREATKALGELGRVQEELRALDSPAGALAGARAGDGQFQGEEEDDGLEAELAEGWRAGARSRSATPAARAKHALASADGGGDFATPAGSARPHARRTGAAPGMPRSADAHGRAPDKLGLHRIEHAAASLAEKMREFEAANGGKPVWRPGGTIGAASATRPRTAGAPAGAHGGSNGVVVGGSFGGYTEMLVEMATKLLGYLGEAEARVKAEEGARKRIATDFEKRLAALEATANSAHEAAAVAQAELEATRKSHGVTLDALVSKVRAARCPRAPLPWAPATGTRHFLALTTTSRLIPLPCVGPARSVQRQVATLEHASGHAHVTSLLAALQSTVPQPQQPAPRPPSAGVTPVRATAYARPSAAEPAPTQDVHAWAGASSRQQHRPAGGPAANQAPYAAAGATVAHRAPQGPPVLAPQVYIPSGAGDGPMSFSAWPHAPQQPASGAPLSAEAFHAAARGFSPLRPPDARIDQEEGADANDAPLSGWALVQQEQDAPPQSQQAAHAAGPAPMARLMIQAAEGAAQLRPPRVATAKGAQGPVRALREAKPNTRAASRAAAQREVGI